MLEWHLGNLNVSLEYSCLLRGIKSSNSIVTYQIDTIRAHAYKVNPPHSHHCKSKGSHAYKKYRTPRKSRYPHNTNQKKILK